MNSHFIPLSKKDKIFYEIKTLLKILRAQYIRKQKKVRTRETVMSDYNNKAWIEILESQYWQKASDLKQFTKMNMPDTHLLDDEKIFALIDNNIVKCTISEIIDYTYDQQYKIIKQNVSETDKIIELGCGFGLAIFSLKARGLNNNIEGYDISENAIKSARMINDHFNCGVKFGMIDLSKSFDSSFLNGKIVFTSHSFEQLKYYTKTAIESILDGNPKQVIHFEPVPELAGFTLREIVLKQANNFADYQNNLLSTLKKLEKDKLLKILEVRKLGHATPFNETSYIKWKPC